MDNLNGAGKANWLLFFGLDKWAWEGVGRIENFQVFSCLQIFSDCGHIRGQPKHTLKRNKYLYKMKLRK